MPVDPLSAAAMGLGIAIAGSGLWLMRYARTHLRRDEPDSDDGLLATYEPGLYERLVAWMHAWSPPTRMTVGICLVLTGYHVLAYASPDPWFPLKVARDRWWALVLILVIALAGAFFAERVERSRDGAA